MSKPLGETNPSHYAGQWGFRKGSQIAALINFAREEHRIKYVSDYQLERIGKNKFIVHPGDYGCSEVPDVVSLSKDFDVELISYENEVLKSRSKDGN